MTTPDPVALVERLRETTPVDSWDESAGEIPRNRDGPEAAAVIQAQAARIAELEGGLKPFAVAMATLSSRWLDHETLWNTALPYPIAVRDLRQARSLLSEVTK